jgi:uncharacterized protein (TIGR02147 family)
MRNTVFDYRNYKNYLNERIINAPSKGRGLKRKMATFLGCQTAFISQVLNQHVNFSLEQAIRLNEFWSHNQEESRFFLLLVQYERAGTLELQQFFEEEMKLILKKRENLKERLDIKDSLDDKNQLIYYSVWYYAAVHICLSIPDYQTPRRIAQYLGLPLKQIQEALEFLVETGLARQKGSRYEIGLTRIHLDKTSFLIRRHHTNWRNQAISSIDRNEHGDLHYSNVLSISREDIPRVKEIFVKAVEEAREIIKVSPEEEVQVLTLDFFTLNSDGTSPLE